MLRVFIGLVAVASALGTVVLLLSDRAPGLVRRLFGDAARSLWARIDADRRAAIEATGATAEPDVVVHVLIWLVVSSLVGLTIWTWRGLAATAIVTALASLALEFGQRRWASTRAFEMSDLVANLVGVGLGTATAAAVIAAWAGVAVLLERRLDGTD